MTRNNPPPPPDGPGILPYRPLIGDVDMRGLRYGPHAFAVLACVTNCGTTRDGLPAKDIATACQMSVEDVERALTILVQANLLSDDRAPF